MLKRLQNKIAESRWSLPVASAYGLIIWLLCGLYEGKLLVSFVCFVVSTYLMVELNNRNALLRIYSRMVSVSFIALSMMMPSVMASVHESIAGMTFVMAIFVWIVSYQDKMSMGRTFYTFSLLSLGSLLDVHLLYYVPLLWISMTFNLQTMSWRTFGASIFGVIMPYWFAALSLFVIDDPSIVISHFAQLANIPMPPDYSRLSIDTLVATVWIIVLAVVGTIHFVRNNYLDSIRIRMIFNAFIFLSLSTCLLIAVMPLSFGTLVRVLIVMVSPLIAHFISLTHTKLTNISFIAMMIVTLAITIFNLWTQLSHY